MTQFQTADSIFDSNVGYPKTKEDVVHYLKGSTDVNNWNRRREWIKTFRKGDDTYLQIHFSALDSQGLIVEVLGEDKVR